MSREYDYLMAQIEQEEKQVPYEFTRHDGSIATVMCRTKDHLAALVYYRILREVELGHGR